MINKNFVIRITLSTQSEVVKASAEEGQNSPNIPEWAKKNPNTSYVKFNTDLSIHLHSDLEFDVVDLSVLDLAKQLMYGRCVGQLYTIEGRFRREHGLSFKDKWFGTQCIAIDIDDSIVTMRQMVTSLKMAPTFSMTTLTHMKDGHKNKYHMFYCFDTILRNDIGVKQIMKTIAEHVKRVLREYNDTDKPLDEAVFSKSAFLYGNPNSPDFEASWEIYSPTDFYPDYSNTPSNSDKLSKQESPMNDGTKQMGIESPLLSDVWSNMHHDLYSPTAKVETLLKKYRKYYYLHFHTKIKEQPDTEAFILPPPDYLALRFLWENKTSKGGRKSKAIIKKWRNGQHRRRIFRAQLCFVLYLHEFKMHIDQLVYHALAIFDLAYSNLNQDGTTCTGDNYITPRMILEIAFEMLRKTPSKMQDLIKEEIDRNKKSFMVNRAGAKAANMSVAQFLAKARKEYYDFLWTGWLKMLKPYIKRGWSNQALADKLEELTSKNGNLRVKRSPATIGERVRPLRDEIRKKFEKSSRRGMKIARKIEKSAFLPSHNVKNSQSHNISEDCCIESSKDYPLYRGTILSQSPQIALAINARKADMQRRYEEFRKFYNRMKTDAANKKTIMSKLNISARTYYNYLSRYRDEERDEEAA